MITLDNLEILLEALEFKKAGETWIRVFCENELNEFSVSVDLSAEAIHYPTSLIVHRATTINFSDDENFVVLEAVVRLFEIGYLPENIELEFLTSIGHGKGKVTGWADIVIRDNNGFPFMLIEAKTSGAEFERAWKDTLADGDQLFSYVNALKTGGSYPYGVLYASDITADGSITRTYRLISFNDSLDLLEDDAEVALFQFAGNERELYRAWADTYDYAYVSIGAFEDDSVAFDVASKNISINDIYNNPLDSTGLIHEFRTILRQHNIGSQENAFDKLLNLLLAKIVDEEQSAATGKSLEFYWKGFAFDDAKSLVDRLQRLYRDGMRDYLHEEVTYIKKSDIDSAFRLFKDDPDATKNTIQEYFNELKFYTDNLFSFIDVYNKRLFNENFTVLSAIVQLFQNSCLTNADQHQFLGDLFERLLDQGIRQSEGQFFTPLPIVRFMIASLPLNEIVSNSQSPRVVDYACGAGHFLTEWGNQARMLLGNNEPSQFFANTFGIEKESRLAKVSKVSSLMYGFPDFQIIYQDALASFEEIQDGSVDVIVSNPPYAVEGFLETLSQNERKRFEISSDVSNLSKNKAIEAFFVERLNQLLRPGGVAAVVLPSPLLIKSEKVYVSARKILIENFDIIAIFEPGKETFSKTGQETVTLFLRKRSGKPSLREHFKNRINCWRKDDHSKDSVFGDIGLLVDFCELVRKTEKEVLGSSDYAERLLWFMIASQQDQSTLVIKGPKETKAARAFLGYEWRGRKGQEGIWYPNDGDISTIQTPLFDPDDFNSPDRINSHIRNAFKGITCPNSEYEKTAHLVQMIRWDAKKLDLSINLNAAGRKQHRPLKPGERLVSLGDKSLFKLDIGRRILSTNVRDEGPIPVFSANVNEPFGYTDTTIVSDFSHPSILWGIDGDWQVGYVPEGKRFCPTDHTGYIRVLDPMILPRFIVPLIYEEGLQEGFSRSNRASITRIENISIIVPPIDEQEPVVKRLLAEDDRRKQLQQELG